MSVVYQRSGGFTGAAQTLTVSDEGVARTKDRFRGESERTLTLEEHGRLAALIERARAAPPPASQPPIADGFSLQLFLDDEAAPRATFATVVVPVEESDGTPWGDLLLYVDRLLTAQLERGQAR